MRSGPARYVRRPPGMAVDLGMCQQKSVSHKSKGKDCPFKASVIYRDGETVKNVCYMHYGMLKRQRIR